MPIEIKITAETSVEMLEYIFALAGGRPNDVQQILKSLRVTEDRSRRDDAATQARPFEPTDEIVRSVQARKPFVETTDRADEVAEEPTKEPKEPTEVSVGSTPRFPVEVPETAQPKRRRRPSKAAEPEKTEPEPEQEVKGEAEPEPEIVVEETKIEPKHEPEVAAAASGLAELPRDVKNLINQAYLHGKSKRASDLLREHGLGAKSYRELNTVALQAVVQAVRGGYLAA